jgi:hypothetical protein
MKQQASPKPPITSRWAWPTQHVGVSRSPSGLAFLTDSLCPSIILTKSHTQGATLAGPPSARRPAWLRASSERAASLPAGHTGTREFEQ